MHRVGECPDQERPKEFKTAKQTLLYLVTYQREKK